MNKVEKAIEELGERVEKIEKRMEMEKPTSTVHWYGMDFYGMDFGAVKVKEEQKTEPFVILMTPEEMKERLLCPETELGSYCIVPYYYTSEPSSTLRALEVSLEKWERLAKVEPQQFHFDITKEDLRVDTCALCYKFYLNPFRCKGCPIGTSPSCCNEWLKTRNGIDGNRYTLFHQGCQEMVELLKRKIREEKTRLEAEKEWYKGCGLGDRFIIYSKETLLCSIGQETGFVSLKEGIWKRQHIKTILASFDKIQFIEMCSGSEEEAKEIYATRIPRGTQ